MIYEAGINVMGDCQCLTADGVRLDDVLLVDVEQKRLVRYVIPFKYGPEYRAETYSMTFESVDITFMKLEDGVESHYPNKFVIHGLKPVE